MSATLRQYVNVKPMQSTDDLGIAFKKMTIAHNRLGGAITNIGVSFSAFRTVFETYADSTLAFKEEEKALEQEEHDQKMSQIEAQKDLLGRKKGLQQDKRAEEKQENLNAKEAEAKGEELGKKEKKDRFGWLKGLLKPLALLFGALAKIVAIPIALGVFEWLSDPKNKEKIEKILGFFKGVWQFSRMLTKFGMGLVLDGVTEVFGHDPDKGMIEGAFDKLFGVLKIFGGLAALWAASRVLMPWKLVGDVNKMFALGKAVSAAEKTGCGPQVGKGNRVGRDGRTSRQRLKDIKKLRRQRRLAALNKKIGQRWAASAVTTAASADAVVDLATTRRMSPFQLEQARKKLNAPGASDIVEEATEAVAEKATQKNALGQLGDFLSGQYQKGKSIAKEGLNKVVQAKNFVVDVGGSALGKVNKWWTSNSKRFVDGVKGVGQGIWNWGANTAKSIGDVAAMAKNPKKLGSVVLEKVKGFIKPIIEKNETAKKVTEFVSEPDKPKKAKNFIGNLLKSGFKNPGFKTFREFLQAAKSNAKIGGIDKLVASVLALLDYTVFGESPINAVLKALGGLLGYSAGFAIGAPFGGVPGFITGAAGGFAGEWAADRLLEVLAKTPLKDIDDPVAELLGADEGGGFMGFGAKRKRKLVRDPNVPQPWEEDLLAAAENDDGAEKTTPAGLDKLSAGGKVHMPSLAMGGEAKAGVKNANQKKKDIPKPTYTTPTPLVTKFDIPTKGEGQFKRFASGGLYVFSTAPAGSPVMMGNGKGYADTYPHHAPKAGGNVPRAGGIPRDYLISELSNPSQPDSKGDRHPIRAGVSGTVDSVGEGWGAVRIKDDSGPIFRSGHMTGIKVGIGDKVTPSTIIGIQDAVGMGNGYVHAHIEGKTPAIHNAWLRANIGAASKDTGSDADTGGDPSSQNAKGKATNKTGGGDSESQQQDEGPMTLEKLMNYFGTMSGKLDALMGQSSFVEGDSGSNLAASPSGTSTDSGFLSPTAASQLAKPMTGMTGNPFAPSMESDADQSKAIQKAFSSDSNILEGLDLNTKNMALSDFSKSKVKFDYESSFSTKTYIAVQPVIAETSVPQKPPTQVVSGSSASSPMIN